MRSRRRCGLLEVLRGRIISACAEQTATRWTIVKFGSDHLRVCGADAFCHNCGQRFKGSSPRVRSRRLFLGFVLLGFGIISACAEQTGADSAGSQSGGDHLRVCGADSLNVTVPVPLCGSSPRVRSRLRGRTGDGDVVGIISACAEQTLHTRSRGVRAGDHLRVCGADVDAALGVVVEVGSSPRVRSRRRVQGNGVRAHGIISACAEQTRNTRIPSGRAGDHLRVCGADGADDDALPVGAGSSPRVRSRPVHRIEQIPHGGIISACAEQTEAGTQRGVRKGDHLRVCGADDCSMPSASCWAGSSPRVRSRPMRARHGSHAPGIISACAEQTHARSPTRIRGRDHLRVCGADAYAVAVGSDNDGSSPRVRSRHRPRWIHGYGARIISACAEQTRGPLTTG